MTYANNLTDNYYSKFKKDYYERSYIYKTVIKWLASVQSQDEWDRIESGLPSPIELKGTY